MLRHFTELHAAAGGKTFPHGVRLDYETNQAGIGFVLPGISGDV